MKRYPSLLASPLCGILICALLLSSCTALPPTEVVAPPTQGPTKQVERPAATPEPTRPGAVDRTPFKEMARAGGCNDIRNRLFLIDDELVFWDIAGNCSDGAYSEQLYGSTPAQLLCVFHDSIAGPVKKCLDERYRAMFDTITANLSKSDLGLGPGHTVQPVPF